MICEKVFILPGFTALITGLAVAFTRNEPYFTAIYVPNLKEIETNSSFFKRKIRINLPLI